MNAWALAEDHDCDAVIATQVGNRIEVISFRLFAATHAELATTFRSDGLVGDELDAAIVAALPHALASALHRDATTVH